MEPNKMRAVVYTEYGPPEVLGLTEVEKPVPKDNEVLIRIRATTVNYGDLLARNFRYVSSSEFAMPMLFWMIAKIAFGRRKPRKKILGNEFSGVIEAIGRNVTLFKKGDDVFGCSSQKMGAYAEYIALPEDGILSLKPSNMSFEEAAVVPYGSIMALNLLKRAKIKSGDKVLINGASGGIGSATVQLAKSQYDVEVTGVCGTPRLEFVRSLGADKTIDYTKEDFTEHKEKYDVIFGGLGKTPYSRVKHSLAENGRYVLSSFKLRQLGQMLRTKAFGRKKVICALLPEKGEDLRTCKAMIEDGKIRAIIDKHFRIEEIVDAHRYVEEGHKRGHIAILGFDE
ncbi:MAG: NAD(P)-dependent alcohol dehydrogenase [Candidatus Heimdallarchaeota archaeon]